MKNICIILCTVLLFACNNEASDTTANDTTSSFSEDTSVLDPTTNRNEATPRDTTSTQINGSRDTSMSSGKRDSAR